MDHFVWFACFGAGVLVGCALAFPILAGVLAVTGLADGSNTALSVVLVVLGFAYIGSFSVGSPWPPALDGFLRGLPLAPVLVTNLIALYMYVGERLGMR